MATRTSHQDGVTELEALGAEDFSDVVRMYLRDEVTDEQYYKVVDALARRAVDQELLAQAEYHFAC